MEQQRLRDRNGKSHIYSGKSKGRLGEALFGWIMRNNMEKIDMDLITGLLVEEKEKITGELRVNR